MKKETVKAKAKAKNTTKAKNKEKATKKILLYSLLLIVASVAVFVGATYAWFSDSVTTENNKITAGNLDIELYHKKGDTREKITEETKLFDMALWEPGAIVYENFEIVNEGSLALYYEFVLNIVKFNIVNDTNNSLKDVLKVAIVEGEFSGDREAAKALEYRQNISNFIKEKSLNANESDKFAIVVYWEPSDADNNYNLNNGKTSSDGQPLYIDLGINLEARQHTQEEDSFGNDYDKDAIIVSDSDSFQSTLDETIGIGGTGTIKLESDIDFNYNSTINKYLIFPKESNITLDLNNHTLSNKGAQVYVDPKSTIKIKNGTLNIDRTNVADPGIYVQQGNLTLENVDVYSATASAIMPMYRGTVINIVNCNFDTLGYAISTNASKANYHNPVVNIKNSHIISSSASGAARTPILWNIPGQLNIEDSVIEGHHQGVVVRGGTAVIKNSTITNNVATNEYLNKFSGDTVWGSGNDVPNAVLTMGNKYNKASYNYPTNVTLINTTLYSIDNIYPEVYAYGNTEDGMGVTFTYDGTSTVGKVVVGNDKVVINGVNAPVGEQ